MAIDIIKPSGGGGGGTGEAWWHQTNTEWKVIWDDLNYSANSTSTGAGPMRLRSVTPIVEAITSAEGNRNGVVSFSVSGTGYDYMRGATQGLWIRGTEGMNFRMGAAVNIKALPDAVDDYEVCFGLNNATNSILSGCSWIIRRSQSGTKWVAYTRDSGITYTVTTADIDVDTWTNLEVEVNAAGTEVLFYKDGALLATHTTNIPSMANGFHLGLDGIAGSPLKAMFMDTVYLATKPDNATGSVAAWMK